MNKNHTILVIDDDPGILEAFKLMLESEEYTVETSPNGDCIIEQVQTCFPSLIILDVLLSGKDGREICKQLKSNEKTKNVPIIMVSAHPKAKESVFDSGANDFLEKPFEMNDLLEKVANYMKKEYLRKNKSSETKN